MEYGKAYKEWVGYLKTVDLYGFWLKDLSVVSHFNKVSAYDRRIITSPFDYALTHYPQSRNVYLENGFDILVTRANTDNDIDVGLTDILRRRDSSIWLGYRCSTRVMWKKVFENYKEWKKDNYCHSSKLSRKMTRRAIKPSSGKLHIKDENTAWFNKFSRNARYGRY